MRKRAFRKKKSAPGRSSIWIKKGKKRESIEETDSSKYNDWQKEKRQPHGTMKRQLWGDRSLCGA